MTGPINRATDVYRERGARELISRLGRQVPYQLKERIFGSRIWFRTRAFVNGLRYNTVADLYRITYVDPAEIEYFSARWEDDGVNIALTRWRDIGRIVDGDWDLNSQTPEYAIEESLLYRSIESHFHRDVPWEDTEYVRRSLEQLRTGDSSPWRAVVRREDDLWERCDQLDALYERISESGYKSKREVFDSQSGDPMGYYPRTFKYSLDEVMVDIARDGTPLLVDGKHRLYMAKVCGVEEIPVVVVVRHPDAVDGDT